MPSGLVWFCYFVTFYVVRAEEVVVQTSLGQLRGTTVTSPDGSNLNVFLGVPFAKPPTGLRRFQKPTPPKPWTGIRDATRFSPACPQQDIFGLSTDEDCLYLNIYTPQLHQSLPVMLFVHGGGNMAGASSMVDGKVLPQKQVILVSTNYRLGPLGFLTTGDTEAPGNFALLDQLMALTWIRDHIAAFGGNPSRVTIFGESAGGSLVDLLLLSPLSKGLIHGAIIESSVSLVPWGINLPTENPPPAHYAHDLGVAVGCDHTNSRDLISCLRNVPAKDLVNVNMTQPVQRKAWAPVVETIFGVIPDPPELLLQKGSHADVPTIRGTNLYEDSRFLVDIPGIENGLTHGHFGRLVHDFAALHYKKHVSQIETLISKVYTANVDISDTSALRTAYGSLLGDQSHTAPADKEMKLLARRRGHNSLFYYMFGYRSRNDPRPEWIGVTHGDELAYVFGLPFCNDSVLSPFFNQSWTFDDRKVSDDVMTMWANFAKYGHPTPQPVGGVSWTPYLSGSQTYLYIDHPAHLASHLRSRKMKMWNEDIPRLEGRHRPEIVG